MPRTTKQAAEGTTKQPINAEHIRTLTAIFQEVRTEGYMHDYDGDYKIIGMALKRVKEYDIDLLTQVLEYFKQYGLKQVDKMQGFLIWAFKNPNTAMQPYNTIDGQKGNRGGVNEQRKTIKPTGRDYYDELFRQVDASN